MLPRLLVHALIVTVGCTPVHNSFSCTDNASCRDGSQTGTCQPNGSCSFADGTCMSGQRYGNASDPRLAGLCVGDESTGDGGVGGIDVPPATDMLMMFTTTDDLPVPSHTHASAVRGDKIYVSGGIAGTTARDQVFIGTVNVNPIEPELTLQGGWTATTPLPATRRNHGMAISGDYIYVVGGRTGASSTVSADVLSAPIDISGNVGAWTMQAPMPFVARCAPAVATPTHLYVIGGKDPSNPVDRILYATTSSGTTGTWNLAGRLPVALYCPAALIHNQRLLVIGGCGSNGQGPCSTLSAAVYSAPILSDGSLGVFTNLESLPAGRWHHAAAIGNGFVYVVGGSITGNGSTEEVWAAPINPDNTLGAWGVSRPLPIPRNRASAQVVGDYLFVITVEVQVARLK